MITQLDTKTVYNLMDSLVSIKNISTGQELGLQKFGHDGCGQLYGAYHFS